jgi:hypothetical protein
MQSDQNVRYALILTADAGRYALQNNYNNFCHSDYAK